MAVIINAGGTGATGNHTATGPTEVIASGLFAGATVELLVAADLQDAAFVHEIRSPGAVSLQAAAGTVITATVIGGQGTPVIDVTMNP